MNQDPPKKMQQMCQKDVVGYTLCQEGYAEYILCQKGCGGIYIGRVSVDSSMALPQKIKFRASCLFSLLKDTQ